MVRLSDGLADGLLQGVGWPVLALVAAARSGWLRRSWLLEFVDTWQLYVLAAWPLLGLLAARLRSPGLGLLATCGGGLAFFHGRRVVGRARRPDPVLAPRLRILTANVLGGNPSAAGLAELILREQPDLVALQEVRAGFGADLVERIGGQYPYHQVQAHHRYSGAACFSRRPLRGLADFRLSERGHQGQHASLEVDGQRLHLLNVHLEVSFEIYRRRRGFPRFGIRYRPRSARDVEIDRLLELLAELDGPAIVVGDFNSAAGSRPHRRLLRYLRDAFLEAGRGLGHTFPRPVSVHGLVVPLPLLRIDYVFFNGPLQPLVARTLSQPGSDHRAVLVDFALPRPARTNGVVPHGEVVDAIRLEAEAEQAREQGGWMR